MSDYTRRAFLQSAAAGAAGVLAGPGALAAAAGAGDGKGRKPNIIFIMADDLGYECLGCNGGTSYKTPHLDALAAGGVRFTGAHCTPLCTPTRVQVMTGQYPFRNGWPMGIWTLPRAKQVLDPKLPNFAHVLKAAGYATAVAGKWQLARFEDHPNHARQCGFDEHCLWTWLYGPGGGKNPPRYWKPYIWQNGKLNEDVQKDDVFGPDVCTDFLIDFMRRNKDKPFFAYYPMLLTHLPLVPTPANRGQAAAGKAGPKKKAKDPRLFAGMVEYADALVGRIVAALDKLGLRENTLIVFTGDNGTPRGITSRMGRRVVKGGKGSMADTGSHVPLIANWVGTATKAAPLDTPVAVRGVSNGAPLDTPVAVRGVSNGAVCDDLVDFSDVLPTFADAAGAAVPRGHTLDGRSFLPQLRGRTGNPRDWVYIQLGKRWAVRTKQWKLHSSRRLFGLTADPLEQSPILPEADTPQSAAARKALRAALKQIRS